MNDPIYEIVSEGVRTLFLLAVPVLAAASVAGVIASFIQSALSIPDSVVSYAVRLAAVGTSLYLLLPSFVRTLLSLAELSLR